MKKSDAIEAAEKAYVIGCRISHILCKKSTQFAIIAPGSLKPNVT